MVVFYPTFTEYPIGKFNTFLGDTIKNEFLVNPDDAEAVLAMVGIRRDLYEKAQTTQEIKHLAYNDITKLKAYLSGPGITDARFKESVRSMVNKRFQTNVINTIERQQWQRFVLKADDFNEYVKMKEIIGELKTGALASLYAFDDENTSVIIEATNSIMSLDKQNEDGAVRVSNIKGKDKPMNFSEGKLYGSIESNSNWIASDLYMWLRENGFEAEQITTERKYELGAKATAKGPSSFKEGQRHGIELLAREERLFEQASEALSAAGILIGEGNEAIESNKEQEDQAPLIDADTVEEKFDDTPAESTDEVALIQQEKSIEEILNAGLEKSFQEKMKADAAILIQAKEMFPLYMEHFERFLPHSASIEMTQQKAWEAFKELRSNANAAIIQKHLSHFALQRMFQLNQMVTAIQKENLNLKQSSESMKRGLEQSLSEVTHYKSEVSRITSELNDVGAERDSLLEKLDEGNQTIEAFKKDFEEIESLVGALRDERDSMIGFKEENVRLQQELQTKESLLNAKNIAYESIVSAQQTLVEAMGRIELQLESSSVQNRELAAERERLSEQVNSLRTQLESSSVQNRELAAERERLSEQVNSLDSQIKAQQKAFENQQSETQPVKTVDHESSVGTENPAAAEPMPVSDLTERMQDMNAAEATSALSEEVQEAKSSIAPEMPKIRIRPLGGAKARGGLAKATESLNRINESMNQSVKK